MSISAMTAFANKVIRGNTGYDQSQRWTYFNIATKTFIPNKETDCSAFCGGIALMGGYPVDVSNWFYTGNMKQRMTAVGFRAIRFTSLKQLRHGDFVLNEQHHVEYVGPDGRFASASIDENGRATGGKAGNQTGRETRWTNPYIYAKGGWHWILRPTGNPSAPTDYNPGNFPASYVRNIQTLLTKLGYSVGKSGIDGSLGPDTFNAVKAFQKAYGLVVDGVPGPATLAKLNSLVSKPATPSKPAKLDVDSYWGPGTTDALQYINGTPRDKTISDQPWANRIWCYPDAAWKWTSYPTTGSTLIRKMQTFFKSKRLYNDRIDGFAGPNFNRAMVLYYGGRNIGEAVANMQRAINKQLGY